MDVLLSDGQIVVAHCPNTGAMRGLLNEGCEAYISYDKKTGRKLDYTLQALESEGGMVGVNTHLPNQAVSACLEQRLLPEFPNIESFKKEVVYKSGVRLDYQLFFPGKACYLEVKNVHYQEQGVAFFPDSRTERGVKHLEALSEIVANGGHAAVVYIVQRSDITAMSMTSSLDPAYSQAAAKACALGVQFLAYKLSLRGDGIFFAGRIPFAKDAVCVPIGC